MTNYIGPYTNQDGTPCLIDADNVGAFIEIPALGALYTGVFPVGVFASPFVITTDPTTFGATLAGLGRTLSPQVPDDGTPVVFVVGNGPNGTVLKTVGTAPDLTAVYAVDSDPFIVLGDLAALAAALTPPPSPPFGIPFRNTYDGYSSDLRNGTDFITTDADRTMTAAELVHMGAIVWQGGTYVRRTWTMPTIAQLDAEILSSSSGKPVSQPGSGGRTFYIINPSQAELVIADSDLQSFGGSHVIKPGQVATISWGQALANFQDGVPTGPAAAGYTLTTSAEPPLGGTVWAGGLLQPATGAILYGFGGLAQSAPYTPGSGIYGLQMNPIPPGFSYVLSATLANVAQALVYANPGGGSSFTIAADSIPAGAWGDASAINVAVILVNPPIS
jgi:hypothetical protein